MDKEIYAALGATDDLKILKGELEMEKCVSTHITLIDYTGQNNFFCPLVTNRRSIQF